MDWMPKTGCYEDATVPLKYCLGIMFLEWRGFDQIPFKIGIQDLAIGMKLGTMINNAGEDLIQSVSCLNHSEAFINKRI